MGRLMIVDGSEREGTGKAITEGAFYRLSLRGCEAARLRGCDPSWVGGILLDTGGVASLNPRLMAVIPPGWVWRERMGEMGEGCFSPNGAQ